MNSTDPLLNTLNEAQRQAVTASLGNMLVLAGAGSGKTRTLVHRIVWLIKQGYLSHADILAVTFTNKAAYEMRLRLETLLGGALGGLWIGTFHSIAHRFLRLHYQEVGLPDTFQILDSDDQLRLIRQLHKRLNLDEVECPPRKIQHFINACKGEGKRSADLDSQLLGRGKRILIDVYSQYEQECQQSGAVDFAELLLRVYEVLKGNEVLLAHYRARFKYVVIDEFQDTSTIEYGWLRLLANPNTHVMAVGDDDQSIYSWRGAKSDNLKRFQEEFKDVSVVVLDQNYRSTGTILEVANQVISKNKNRIGKALWTDSQRGDLVSLFCAYNEFDEARFIASQIRSWVAQGHSYDELAILYRSNAQSRVLEETLTAAGVPFRVYGGQRFFERAEIKDVLAYMRLLMNRNDDTAFERIVNVPARGLGHVTLQLLRDYAQQEGGLSLWCSAESLLQNGVLGARPASCLRVFLSLINDLDQETQLLDLPDQFKKVLSDSGLRDHFKKERTEKGVARLENLQELVTAAQQFQVEYAHALTREAHASDTGDTEAHVSALSPRVQAQQFLAQVALDTGDVADADERKVHMMTLHSAKGLEFPIVFLSGLEQGLFPHQLSFNDPARLEEERRLCYVGMTRAKKKLFLSYAQSRCIHGREKINLPSPFIMDVPRSLIDELPSSPPPERSRALGGGWKTARNYSKNKQPPSSYSSSFSYENRGSQGRSATLTPAKPVSDVIEDTQLKMGQTVKHPKFGAGTILNYEGRGAHTRVQVKFNQYGIKWLVLSYLQVVSV